MSIQLKLQRQIENELLLNDLYFSEYINSKPPTDENKWSEWVTDGHCYEHQRDCILTKAFREYVRYYVPEVKTWSDIRRTAGVWRQFTQEFDKYMDMYEGDPSWPEWKHYVRSFIPDNFKETI